MREATAVILDCMAIRLAHLIIPQKIPGALYFSKALIEGLISGGAYIRRDMSRNAHNNKNGKKKNMLANLANMAKMTILPQSPTGQSTKQ